jgi:regulator of sigma E protease
MVDESMDKEQMKLPPQEWEFRSKPAWQRLIVMIGGVTVNIVFALLIYMMIAFVWGDNSLPASHVKYGIMCDSTALNIGLMNGDHIVSIGGEEVEDFYSINKKLLLDRPATIEIDRNGKKMTIDIPKNFVENVLKKKSRGFISPRGLFAVGDFPEGSGAQKAGLKKGDFLVALNGEKLMFYDQFAPRLVRLKNKQVSIGYIRTGQYHELSLPVDADGKIGVFALPPIAMLDIVNTRYGFFESIPKGVSLGVTTLTDYLKQFRILFTKEGAKQIGGFGTFAGLFGTSWDWESFWRLTAFISIILAVMNILPIPALDGGHVMFLLYEIVTRRKPNQKAMEYAQMAGMVLLLALLLFANGNDIFRHFKH